MSKHKQPRPAPDWQVAQQLRRERDALLETCRIVEMDICAFLAGDWDGSREGWQALIDRLENTIIKVEASNATKSGSLFESVNDGPDDKEPADGH